MPSWKEKLTNKLSRLLAESPSSSSPLIPASPVSDHESQAVYFSSEEFTRPKKTTFSKYIFSLLPTSSGVDADKPNSPAHQKLLPFLSLPPRWKSDDLVPKDSESIHSEDCITATDETVGILKENLNHVSENNVNRSNGIQEAKASHDPEEYLSYLSEKSTFISANLFEFFQSSLPNIVKGCKWILLYSTWKHGISLRTLLHRSANLPSPFLLIVGDMQGAIFGGLFDGPLKPTAKRKYQGTSHTFVFTTIYGEPRLFRATGSNRYYYLCLNDALAFGGGRSFALYLEEDLLHGTSGPSETFGNLCLGHSAEFEIKNVELWGFTHSSKYFA